MLTGLTRREQRILLFLIGIIVAGLAIHRSRTGSHRDVIFSSPKTDNANQKESGLAGLPADIPLSQPSLININTASLEELCLLHGIGPVKAKAIIDYRNVHKGYKTLEEITKVPGIGMSTFQKIRERITLGSAGPPQIESRDTGSSETTVSEPNLIADKGNHPVSPTGKVDINIAGLEDLMTLEQIGEIKAQRILEYRARYGPFRSVKDLLKIRGIGEKTLNLNRDKITVGDDQKIK
jgi:competence protein ComEA